MFCTIKVVNPNTQTRTKISITRRGDQKNIGQKINQSMATCPIFLVFTRFPGGQVGEVNVQRSGKQFSLAAQRAVSSQ